MTHCSRIKDRGFDINVENARVENFKRIIQSQGWLCKHPKATAMIVVHEFFANATESTSNYRVFVRGKQVKYDTRTINQLFRLPYNPSGLDKLDYLIDSANMEEVSIEISKGGTRWTIVKD